MKKPPAHKRLLLSRETLASLDRLDGALLDQVAGGGKTFTCAGSSCTRPLCTCF